MEILNGPVLDEAQERGDVGVLERLQAQARALTALHARQTAVIRVALPITERPVGHGGDHTAKLLRVSE